MEEWQRHKPEWITLHVVELTDVPRKIGGVGHARKTGMDLAYDLAVDKHNAIIVCYDADCTCTDNYLTHIASEFKANEKADVATIYFEHDTHNSQAIVDYELFLRYHYQGLKYTGYPYAYQTIGSSMAVRADTYQQFGGMNQRKAGEDFYFLHKIIPYREVIEINDCCVFPSNRTSDRVPFGTGHAVAKHQESACKTYYTYHPSIYQDIQLLVSSFNTVTLEGGLKLEAVSPEIKAFLAYQKFDQAYQQFVQQAKSDRILQTSLFRWLNGFRMLKLVHHLRDKQYTNIPLNEAVTLFWKINNVTRINQSNTDWLHLFRTLEKQ